MGQKGRMNMKNSIFQAWLILLMFNGVVYGESKDRLAITGATIIDGTGNRPISNGTILIEHGRITSVGKNRDITIPDNYKKIQARGKFLIPGLMDANLHLFLNIDLLFQKNVQYKVLEQEISLQAFLFQSLEHQSKK